MILGSILCFTMRVGSQCCRGILGCDVGSQLPIYHHYCTPSAHFSLFSSVPTTMLPIGLLTLLYCQGTLLCHVSHSSHINLCHKASAQLLHPCPSIPLKSRQATQSEYIVHREMCSEHHDKALGSQTSPGHQEHAHSNL
jgi:hypothetical protein